MTWWMWLIVSVTAYAFVGRALARWDAPEAWRMARDAWRHDTSVAQSVRARFLCVLLFWPITMAFFGVMRYVRNATTQLDPREVERENRDLRDTITRLEREAGIR